jgi:transaldolase
MNPSDLQVKVFADGADRDAILQLYANPLIKGFTTNPTLMRKAGVEDYEWFAREILQAVPDRPFSFEVFADDDGEMERQALKISAWGENVYVKIPVTTTKGEPTGEVLRRLSQSGVKVNVTALMTAQQVEKVIESISDGPAAYVSVFAGRVADSGIDPIPIMRDSLAVLRDHPGVELIWASPRELHNIIQAHEIGCDIITVTHDLLQKLPTLGKDLDEFSLDTVKMFHRDAATAGYRL